MTAERVFKWLFLATGVYVLLCIPAVFIAEQFHLRESPIHGSQFLATAACIPSAAAYLWFSRTRAPHATRWVAAFALAMSLLWIGLIVAFVFGGDPWPTD